VHSHGAVRSELSKTRKKYDARSAKRSYRYSSLLPSASSVTGAASSPASSAGAQPVTLTANAIIMDAINALITFPFPFWDEVQCTKTFARFEAQY